jgi:hypothetical protein
MNKRGKKEYILKIVCTLVLTTALICSTTTALTNNALGALKQNSSIHTTNAPTAETGFKVVLSENFSQGIMPPINWQLIQTNQHETWYIDDTLTKYPNAKPSATVNRGGETKAQDEWLITPSINFSKFKEAFLDFYWYTCQYVTSHRYIEFNISVSTNGSAWERVWSFDDSINRWFLDWTWYNYFNYNNSLISLNKYLGKWNVRIAFQYNSTHTEYTPEQYFSIDDIQLLVNGSEFACSPGGPYNWWYPMQYLNPPGYPDGVRFNGTLYNGTTPPTKWLWDFGDGNTSPLPYFTIHEYRDPGFYNVTLTCTDNSIAPPRIAIGHTTLNLFLAPPPHFDISPKMYFSLGIKADITNKAKYNATNVTWTITTEGTFQLIQRTVGNGTINNMANGTSETIRSKILFSFGTGFIYITISVSPENFFGGAPKRYLGFKIGPFVSIFKEIT